MELRKLFGILQENCVFFPEVVQSVKPAIFLYVLYLLYLLENSECAFKWKFRTIFRKFAMVRINRNFTNVFLFARNIANSRLMENSEMSPYWLENCESAFKWEFRDIENEYFSSLLIKFENTNL